MNPISIVAFALAVLCGIGAGVMLVVYLIQKSHADKRQAEMTTPPAPPPAGWTAPTMTEVEELKGKAKGSLTTMVVLAALTIVLVLAGIFVPTALAAPVSSAGGPTTPVSVGPAAGAATSCTDPRPADANGFTTECGADGQWHFVPLNGIAGVPVCDGTQNSLASQGLAYDDCQYYDNTDGSWKLLSAFYGGAPASSGPQSPANTTCTIEQLEYWMNNGALLNGVDCQKSDGTLLSASAKSSAGGATNTTCTIGQLEYWMNNGALLNGVDCQKSDGTLLSASAKSSAGGPTIITATPGAPADNAVTYVQLNYDKNPFYQGDCMNDDSIAEDPKVAGQTHYPAFEICKANAAGATQAALEAAIIEIQAQAQATGAKTLVGNSITLPNESAWLVWIPNASTFDYALLPNDTAYPTGLVHPALGQIWIVPAYAAGVNGRTFQNADYELYAVAVK